LVAQVLEAAAFRQWFSEDCRSEMAVHWTDIERRDPGRISTELGKAEAELEGARRRGRELAFPRLKRDVLQMASRQLS